MSLSRSGIRPVSCFISLILWMVMLAGLCPGLSVAEGVAPERSLDAEMPVSQLKPVVTPAVRLAPVVVTATRGAVMAEQVMAPVTVIDRAQDRELAGANLAGFAGERRRAVCDDVRWAGQSEFGVYARDQQWPCSGADRRRALAIGDAGDTCPRTHSAGTDRADRDCARWAIRALWRQCGGRGDPDFYPARWCRGAPGAGGA